MHLVESHRRIYLRNFTVPQDNQGAFQDSFPEKDFIVGSTLCSPPLHCQCRPAPQVSRVKQQTGIYYAIMPLTITRGVRGTVHEQPSQVRTKSPHLTKPISEDSIRPTQCLGQPSSNKEREAIQINKLENLIFFPAKK